MGSVGCSVQFQVGILGLASLPYLANNPLTSGSRLWAVLGAGPKSCEAVWFSGAEAVGFPLLPFLSALREAGS